MGGGAQSLSQIFKKSWGRSWIYCIFIPTRHPWLDLFVSTGTKSPFTFQSHILSSHEHYEDGPMNIFGQLYKNTVKSNKSIFFEIEFNKYDPLLNPKKVGYLAIRILQSITPRCLPPQLAPARARTTTVDLNDRKRFGGENISCDMSGHPYENLI